MPLCSGLSFAELLNDAQLCESLLCSMQLWAVLFFGISWRSVLRSVVRLLLSQAFLLPLSVTQCCSDLIRYVVHY